MTVASATRPHGVSSGPVSVKRSQLPLGRLAREQFTATGIALRPEMIAMTALLCVVGGMALIIHGRGGGKADFDLLDFVYPALLLGALASLGVWKNEGPSRRAYMWAMPVPRSAQTLLRVAAGWGWVLLAVVAFLAWGISVALITGGHIVLSNAWELSLLEGTSAGTVVRDFGWHGHPWMWLLPFVGATVAYLAGSFLAVASDHPWRWIGALALASMLVVALGEAGGTVGPLTDALNTLMNGAHGILKLLSGSALESHTLIVEGRGEVKLWRHTPHLRGWLQTAILWGFPPLAAVVALSFRHQER